MGNFLSALVGAFADPIAENPTIVMMEAAFRHHQMDWRYINCRVPANRLHDAVRGAMAMGWNGFNCSLPHKVAILPLLDDIAASAKMIGAVNCVVRREQKLVGENTDGSGFVQAVAAHRTFAGAAMLLLGAGGAARAIAVSSALAGVNHIFVCNRSASRGRALAAHIETTTDCRATVWRWAAPITVPAGVDFLVNATPIGLYPNVHDLPPIDPAGLSMSTAVVDIVANPAVTALQQVGRSVGCLTLGGREMLVNQAAMSLYLWSGVDPDRSVMRGALGEAL